MRCAALVAIAGCWRGGDPAEPRCEPYGFRVLYGAPMSSSQEPAQRAYFASDEAATREFDAASEAAKAEDSLGAAKHFLACARSYLDAPPVDPWRAIARRNAAICYDNAIAAFATAGVLATQGKAALEQAARDDQPLAPYIRKHLANPPSDCRKP